MATPSEKLATSLEVFKKLQDSSVLAIRSSDLTRVHRERLLKNGFIEEVMKGWYIPAWPHERVGESTAWYASYWAFCSAYLSTRFKSEWCLSPEQSLAIHSGNTQVPKQLLVRSPRARNKITNLPHNTSLFDVKSALPKIEHLQIQDGLRIFSLASALVSCSPMYFKQHPIEIRTALALIKSPSDILRILLDGGHSTIAGRLIGAFRNIGRDRIADDILRTMRAADYTIQETDPFEEKLALLDLEKNDSAITMRLKLMWQKMRIDIIGRFPDPVLMNDSEAYLKTVDELYTTDAYHSLSIEGYKVNLDLIERVRTGEWNPESFAEDKQQRDAMAARGYWQAFQETRKSVQKCLEGQNAGEVVEQDHSTWYRELFTPSVVAGLLKASDLAGYRNTPVYIRRSMHVPPASYAVLDGMFTLFELLKTETNPAVRVVLGHFIFVYIHPYVDGNGRTGRFMMNVMMAAGGYPWTVIPVERRDEYMSALESASVEQNIIPFTEFLAELV